LRIKIIVASTIIVGCMGLAHIRIPSAKARANTDDLPMKDTSGALIEFSVRPPVCPDDMVEVEGDYCPQVEETCLQWVDASGRTTTDKALTGSEVGRCGAFKQPTRCLSRSLVHKRYCIDRYEHAEPGEKPSSWLTWYDAKRIAEGENKRLCTQSEWTFACEGPEMQPYPYGDGYHRDPTACNFDNAVPDGLDVFRATSHDSKEAKILDGMLTIGGTRSRCVSPFGVHDQVGNIDEWVINEGGHPYVSGLMGGHVFGVRSRCRPITIAHAPSFSWYETGARSCKDVVE